MLRFCCFKFQLKHGPRSSVLQQCCWCDWNDTKTCAQVWTARFPFHVESCLPSERPGCPLPTVTHCKETPTHPLLSSSFTFRHTDAVLNKWVFSIRQKNHIHTKRSFKKSFMPINNLCPCIKYIISWMHSMFAWSFTFTLHFLSVVAHSMLESFGTLCRELISV